jgi:hypothetical protein
MPYHGYWKNLALALTGQMDAHFTALWDHGHIKFWSIRTITQLLTEAGFRIIQIQRIGRISPLAKTMMIVVQRRLDEESYGESALLPSGRAEHSSVSDG